MPKSAKTGREKKTTRLFLKGAREREKADIKAYKESSKELQRIGRGESGLPSDPSKILELMKSTKDLAGEYFKPHQEQALHEFQSKILPGVMQQAGGAEVGTSSAMRQALSATAENLQRQLSSDYSQLQMGLGQDLLNRQQNAELMRYNALNAGLRQQGSLGQTIAAGPNYLQKTQGPNRGKSALGGAIQGGITGFMAGGPVGAAIGAVGGGTAGYFGAGSSSGSIGTGLGERYSSYQQQAAFDNLPSMAKWGS